MLQVFPSSKNIGMNNIFENAYLGKPYQTRDGRKALFQAVHNSEMDSSKKEYSFFTEDCAFHVNEEGKMDFQVDDDVFAYHECHPELDIIGEWQISEDEINSLAEEEYSGPLNWPDEYHNGQYATELVDAYIKGFNKGLEYVGCKR